MPSLAEAIYRGRMQDAGIPTAEEEALLAPDWDPIDAAVAGMTGVGNLPARAMAFGADAISQEMLNKLPWWIAAPAALAMGRAASKAMPGDLVPGGERLAEVGAIGPDVGKYVDVWHASPHRFDRFDSSMIGSGEGSQYRGYGLYFAENPNVSGAAGIGERPSAYDKLFQARIRKTPDFRLMKYGSLADKHGRDDEHIINVLRHGTEAEQQALRRSDPARFDYWQQNRPSIYQVRLHSPQSEFLDLNAPVPQELIDRLDGNVKDMINELADSGGYNSVVEVPEAYNGWDLYTYLQNYNVVDSMPPEIWDAVTAKYGEDNTGKKMAAEFLRRHEVPGTTFLDGFSRNKGLSEDATRNYVMFPGNDDRIEILKRYGILAPLLGGAAMEGKDE